MSKTILLNRVHGSCFAALSCSAVSKPNILFITVDDMNADSVGVFGCPVPDTTPQLDQLAAEGMRFEYAHVQVPNCTPYTYLPFLCEWLRCLWVEHAPHGCS